MRHPIILIVGREIVRLEGARGLAYGTGQTYSQAITRAGGIPIMLPPISDLAERIDSLLDSCDGIVLQGGGDIDPICYGQEISSSTVYGVNAHHDRVELEVARQAALRDIPTLAICRGLQIVNVAFGGTLIQDLDDPSHKATFHGVDLVPDSLVAAAMKVERATNCHSWHHQAIDVLGQNLRVTGRADDGTIEAVESTQATWLVAVQWHPEDSAETDSEQQNLFDALVAACA